MKWNTRIAKLLVVVSNSVKNVMYVVDGCIISQFTADIIMNARIATIKNNARPFYTRTPPAPNEILNVGIW